jgi:hypothetical protein
MPFFLSIAVDCSATLPIGSSVNVSVRDFFDRLFPVTSPGLVQNWFYPNPRVFFPRSLPIPFLLSIEVFVGLPSPIRLEAAIQDDNARLGILVLPGTPQDHRFFFAGNIVCPGPLVVSRSATGCITRLSDGKTAPPGSCIDCESDKAIVRFCC